MPAPRYVAIGPTGQTEVAAIEATTGTAQAERVVATGPDGLLDASLLTKAPGLATVSLPATEAIAAGALCNLYSASGVESVQNADGSVGTKPCNGYALAAIASGATGLVTVSKSVITGLSGLTPGPAYLSETAKGGVQTTGATTPGHTDQKVGEALSASMLLFAPEPAIVRA